MDPITTIEGASSSSSFTHSWTYDIFLSFRGKDTRSGFTGHLNRYLVQKGIRTFIDDELGRGEEISQALLEAIEGSRISIIVFSENYASSRWCLDELVKIIQCKESKQQIVLPIFYKVDPSDVRHHKGSFGEALTNHECNFKNDTKKVLSWKAALTEAANLSGFFFLDGNIESKFLDEFVEYISEQVLDLTDLNVAKHPVGIKSRVGDVTKHVGVEKNDVRTVGIWGIGGIGKTTIARAVYNLMAHKFEGSCFLENVREESIQHGGLVKLQNIIVHKILGGKELQVTNVHEGINVIHKRLSQKRVLLLLDDVNKLDQLYKLVGGSDWSDRFGLGSRIIITTRDKHLLTAYMVRRVYEVKELGDDEAFELFSANAFPGERPPDDYVKLANAVVKYARGLPLALEVLGSVLCGGSIEEWQDALDGYKKVPNPNILETLKVSYNSLEDPVKEVFLDIACFFKGENKNRVIQMLEACGLNPKYGIKVLKEKALLKVNEENHIWMHDLLEEMGKELVHQESPDEPGKRSRLWYHEDVHQVLTEGKGTKRVKSIMVKLPEPNEIQLSTTSFSKMINLQMFINYNAHISGDIGYMPNELRFIDWPDFPFQSLPLNLNPKKLVELNMPQSRMSQLGDGFKSMKNLKSINLESCQFLTKFPEASGFSNLKELNLNYCLSLDEVDLSVGFLDKLAALSLEGCINLTLFPMRIALMSAKYINLRGCRMLKYFPTVVEEMVCLTQLDLSGTAIEDLPSSIGYLISLEVLTLEECENLTNLPSSIYELTHLRSVNLRGCRNLVTFPKWNAECLPTNSNVSHDLWYLNLSGCKNLEEIPDLPPSVEWVNAADCVSLERFAKLSNIMDDKELNMIESITLFNCQKLCYNLVTIEQILLDDASLCSVFLTCRQSEFDVVFPGREVPRWFNHREDLYRDYRLIDESQFSIEIPRNFELENGGLAICAAVEINVKERGKKVAPSQSGAEIGPKDRDIAHSKFGRCSFAARIDMNEVSVASRSFYFEAKDMESAHVCLLYIPFAKFIHDLLPPFTCRVSLEQKSQGLVRCKSYGVHLVLPEVSWGYKKFRKSTQQPETLGVSYNSLEDPVKEVFLDIACFFKGENKNRVIEMLEDCGLNPEHGIKVLQEKALLNVKENHIWMHDFVEGMGKEIVRLESPNEPGERSRLWFHQDVYQVLTEGRGTEKVKSIMVKLPEPVEIQLNAASFSNMINLKMFINRAYFSTDIGYVHFCYAHFSGVIGYMPDELRFVDWPKFPFQSLPRNFNPEKLVKLNMRYSRISRLGDGFQCFKNLKSINLESCQFLTKFAEASEFPNLENLNLSGCKSLKEIPELPPKVEWVNAADCVSLKRFAKLSNILEQKDSAMIECINLHNCQELCDNLARDVAVTGNLLLNEVSLCSVFLTCKQSKFEVVFPGRDVPKWFNHRECLYNLSDRSDFSFEIPPNFKLVNRGLAICAAVELSHEGNKTVESTFCVCTIFFNSCSVVAHTKSGGFYSFKFEEDMVESDHVWLLYIPFDEFSHCPLPPFTCEVRLEHVSKGLLRCKSYGVHLVMPQHEDEENDEDLEDEYFSCEDDEDLEDEYFSCEDDEDLKDE